MTALISSGETVTLVGPRGKFYVKVTGELQDIKGLGVVDTGRFIDVEFGKPVEFPDGEYLALKPSLYDKIDSIQRKAQIILPKDSLQLVGLCDIKSGSIVIEGGAGSGALTIVLSHIVAPGGKVITYESREDFAIIARKNLERVQADNTTEVKLGDATKGFEERDVDAVILDIPNPEEAVEAAWNALKAGGHFAAYVPTMNQVERVVAALRKQRFLESKTLETLQRELVVGKGGVRPSFDMLGHTGYITVARKIL
jgi:tRNA (adenine57-N1/adenine58-N1)-methyltransferase